MTQVYSVPSRESDPYSLPDVEVFYVSKTDILDSDSGSVWIDMLEHDGDESNLEGWYYWYCLPGCLPDGDPIGPFDSEQAAIDAAQEDSWQFEDDDDTEGELDNA